MNRKSLSLLLLTCLFAGTVGNFTSPARKSPPQPEPFKAQADVLHRFEERREELDELKRAARLIELQTRFDSHASGQGW